MTLQLKGVISETVWEEEVTSVSLTIDSIQAYYQKKIGTKVYEDAFPRICSDNVGVTIPSVYGQATKGEIVKVIDACKTTLAVDLAAERFEAVVMDSSNFTQDTYMDLFISRELVRGKFVGNYLKLIQRGKVVATGQTSGMSTTINTFKANLVPQGFNWVGYNFRFQLPGGGWSFGSNVITKFTSPDTYGFKAIEYYPGGLIPAGTNYEIFGAQIVHRAGEEVYEDIDDHTWIINDAPSQGVDRIEIESSIILENPVATEKVKDLTTWSELDPDYYEVNLDDNQFLAELGHNVTTVTMPFDPINLPNSPYSGEMKPIIKGTSTTNPVEVIVDLAETIGIPSSDIDAVSRAAVAAKVSWMNLGFSIQDTKLGLELLYDVAFQSRIALVWEQGLLKFRYLENKAGTTVATFTKDSRELDTLSISQTNDDDIVNYINASWVEDGEVKTLEVSDSTSIALYGEKRRDISFWAHNYRNSVESVAQFWLRRWSNTREVVQLTTFLNSMEVERYDWINLNFPEYYTSQPAEVLGINHQYGTGVGEAPDRITYTLNLPISPGCSSTCELYEETGCASTCEQACQTGCENDCVFSCESTCQNACELICVTVCELECVTFTKLGGCTGDCTSNCQSSCQGFCETSCMTTGCQAGSCTTNCESSEETGCGTSCEHACEVGCETSGCQSTCETECTTGCEFRCQNSCTTGCEYDCQTGGCETSGCQATCEATACTIGCRSGCQGYCMTGCTSGCQTGCELTCTSSCTADCTFFCQASGCQSGCQIDCQTGGCETVGCQLCCEFACQTACQDACQVACVVSCTTNCEQEGCQSNCTSTCERSCRGSCQSLCQSCCEYDGTETSYLVPCLTSCVSNCQTNCQSVCEVNTMTPGECETACQSYCMTAATTGCADYCTVGCECFCQADCQSNCMTTACQTACQCDCQTSTQPTACTLGTEGTCYSSCQGFCQTGCTVGCTAECQAYCQTGCETGCEEYCTIGCKCSCQTSCEDYCTTGCESNCTCTCQSSNQYTNTCGAYCTASGQLCQTTCRISCTSDCQSFCQTGCTATTCVVYCQTFCMTGGCETGCEEYCTVGCQCFCQSDCQSACRTDCQAACRCACQTAAQV